MSFIRSDWLNFMGQMRTNSKDENDIHNKSERGVLHYLKQNQTEGKI